VKRLVDLSAPPAPDLNDFARRGFARQRPRREVEATLRANIVAFHDWTTDLGLTRQQTAELLKLEPRTLRQWQYDSRAQLLSAKALGRPTLRSSRQDRNEVLAVLDELGPRTGLPTLQACFPNLPRAELEDLLCRYRRVWRKRHQHAPHLLHWQVPGSVWAMDFTEAPHPIDGLYPYVLAVRDLASGRQLLWLPLESATAAETIPALEPLFTLYGPPLVLKTDNGSPFCAEATQDFFATWSVVALFSPPYTPRYNGAIEASIGSLKTRTEQHATRHGRPNHWTRDDVAAAQLEANATARPRGPTGPTPDELWTARRKITPEERNLFQTSVNFHRTEVRTKEGWPTEGPLNARDNRTVDRQAIRRALEEHDFLLYSRRRIPLPIINKKVTDIT
jgi:transposase InsO family protein